MEEDLVAKILSMVILGGFSLLLGLIPMKLVEKYNLKEISSGHNENKKEKNKVMSTTFKHLALTALNCFGAGVILTTCFTHMLPEANEALEESSIKNQGYVCTLDILFSSNHNIHKSSCRICFWASDPHIERI